MNVVTVSIVRNAVPYLARFARQLAGLRDVLRADGHALRHIVVEGDSTDGTAAVLPAALREYALVADVSQHAHGGPAFGSVDDPARWAQLAPVYNAALARVAPQDDAVLHVEADLVWAPATLAALVGLLRDYDGVAPMVFLGAYGPFYDTYGHRTLDGRPFQARPPYHPDGPMVGLTEIGAAGNCSAVRAPFARTARWSPVDVSVGWWRDMRAAGARLYLAPDLQVVHP